jgi:hypothetical protein
MRFAWMFLLVFFPPILNVLGLVTKDGLYVPLVFLGYSVALLALQDRATWHASLSAVSQLILVLAISVRSEGAMAALPVFCILNFKLIAESGTLRGIYLAAASFVSAMVIVAAALIAIAIFNHSILRAQRTYPYQLVLMHDLVALSIINNINLLPSVFNPTSFTIDDLKSPI